MAPAPGRRFRYVTWPQLIPVTTIISILTLLGALQIFGTVQVLTNGGPGYLTEVPDAPHLQRGVPVPPLRGGGGDVGGVRRDPDRAGAGPDLDRAALGRRGGLRWPYQSAPAPVAATAPREAVGTADQHAAAARADRVSRAAAGRRVHRAVPDRLAAARLDPDGAGAVSRHHVLAGRAAVPELLHRLDEGRVQRLPAEQPVLLACLCVGDPAGREHGRLCRWRASSFPVAAW